MGVVYSAALISTFQPLQIKSIVVKEGLKGIIYIEAFKQSHVANAINGVSALNQFNVTVCALDFYAGRSSCMTSFRWFP